MPNNGMIVLQTALAFAIAGTVVTTAPITAQSLDGMRVGLRQPAARQHASLPRVSLNHSVAANQWRQGALIGAGVGALFGLAVYALKRSYTETDTSPFVIIGPVFIFALIGGMIGSGHPSR